MLQQLRRVLRNKNFEGSNTMNPTPEQPDPKENSGTLLQEELTDIYSPQPEEEKEKEEECSGSASPLEPCKE